MKLICELDTLPADLRGCAVAIGNFDGVHLGHAKIIEQLRDEARRVGGPAVVFTFDPHPALLLRPGEAPPPLTWMHRKAELLAEQGVEYVISYPTDMELLSLSAREFFDRFVLRTLDAKAVVEGPNFFFGKGRSGTIEVLGQFCSEAGITLKVVEPVKAGEGFISSSRVRRLISDGKIDEATQMLTRPYRIRGMVTHGAGRGATIGFPTANVEAIDTLLPGEGVYAGCGMAKGQHWPAAINVGTNPTFDEHSVKVEVHLIGADVALYGEPLEVDFLSRLRDIQPFDGIEALKAQLTRDVEKAQKIASDRDAL